MTSPLELTTDVITAGAALAGLLLVFMGNIAAAFDGYEKQEQHAVRVKYQHRLWVAFAGFALAIAATIFALIGKWALSEYVSFLGLVLLLVALGWVIFVALRAVLDVK